jgi:PIN domain nuclease of toxin-antitoxin system
MRVLLDTHAFLWWIDQHQRLTATARDAIADSQTEVFVSVVNVWEIVIKAKIGRFTMPGDLASFLHQQITTNYFQILPVEMAHALKVYDLADHPDHKDPFDRLLVAQALSEDMALISNDADLDHYGIERIW